MGEDINTKSEILRLLALGLRENKWSLTSGGKSSFYIDLDAILTTPDAIKKVSDLYLDEIAKAQKEKGRIDRLAFIEKDSGPVGAITLKDLLVVKTGIPGIVIRPQRRVLAAAVKGSESLRPGDKMLLISDVATSGSSILKAAQIAWAFRARVILVIVFFDREQGAVNNLSRYDIEMRSIARRSTDLSQFPELEKVPLSVSTSSTSYMRIRP